MSNPSQWCLTLGSPKYIGESLRRCFHSLLESLQETGVLPTHKNVGENEIYVGKGYADVFHGIENNVRWGIPDAVPTRRGTASRDALTCVGHSGVESSSPDEPYADARRGIGNASFVIFLRLLCVGTPFPQRNLCILVPTFHYVGNFFLYFFKIFTF